MGEHDHGDIPKLESQNSQVRFAESIYEALIHDIASGRPPVLRASLLKDLDTIKQRLKEEGIQFCTIVLPTLSKAMYSSFTTGKFTCPDGFATAKDTTLPRLFGGLLKEIYTDDGALRPNADVASITEVNQLCGLGYKLDIPYKWKSENDIVEGFKEVEANMTPFHLPYYDADDAQFQYADRVLERAAAMIEEIFRGFDPTDILPQHGPGAVASGEKGRSKYLFKVNYEGIKRVFPMWEYYYSCRKHFYDAVSEYRQLKPESFGCAKVILVPKDSRGPRLISMEPVEYQFVQQGLRKAIQHRIENHRLTRRHVNFESQSINRQLAIIGSMNDDLATLDMKDASDRISVELVQRVFRYVPRLSAALMAARSHQTKLPDGTVLTLNKFAPMGSALCFPIMSIVHYAIAVSAIMLDGYTYKEARRSVWVYGDDLIVRRDVAHTVMTYFPLFGLMFNEKKCFIHGPFRESCGMDSYKGSDITPTRWRKPWTQRLDAVTAQGFSEFASLLYQRGYVRAAEVVWKSLEAQVGLKLPTVPLTWRCGYLTRRSRLPYLHTNYQVRSNLSLQCLEHKAVIPLQKWNDEPWELWSRFFENQTKGTATSKELSSYSSLKKRWTVLGHEGPEGEIPSYGPVNTSQSRTLQARAVCSRHPWAHIAPRDAKS